jgi:Putative peptidoglycan binding domain
MAKTHTVKVGENAVSIARREGFSDYRVVWGDDANADLRKKRPDPHLLIPGDEIAIPDPKLKKLTLPTQKNYRLVVHVPKQELRLRIRDRAGKPLAQSPYRLTVETLPKPFEGTTDEDGKLKAIVPVDASSAVLEIDDRRLRLRLKGLAAMPTDDDDPKVGVSDRLENLGYQAAPANDDKEQDGFPRIALAVFQGDAGIDVTGELDPSTRDALKKDYGC